MTYTVHYTGKFYKGLTREMQSPSHSKRITYEVGKTYNADAFEVSDDDCGPGIHVVTSLALALKWGPVVVEVTIPDGAEVVWSEAKLRTSQIHVVKAMSLTGANLYGAYLYGANLARANLTEADLARADLSGAYLYGANLARANLTGANLARADLTRANLARADLAGADLVGADLVGVNLSGADLARANLARADLAGADLVGADLTRADLAGAYGEPASLPDGWKYVNGAIVREVKG